MEEGFALVRVALDGRRLGEDEALFYKRLDDGMGGVAFLGQLGHGHGFPRFREKGEGGSLQRGFLFQGLDFLLADLACEPGEEPRLVADLGFADDIWEHGFHRLLDGAAVVIRHPRAEPEEQGAEDGLGADDRGDELHARHVRLVEQLDDGRERGARPHGNAHARAGLERAGDGLGQLVVKGFPGGVIHEHAGEFRHARRMRRARFLSKFFNPAD